MRTRLGSVNFEFRQPASRFRELAADQKAALLTALGTIDHALPGEYSSRNKPLMKRCVETAFFACQSIYLYKYIVP